MSYKQRSSRSTLSSGSVFRAGSDLLHVFAQVVVFVLIAFVPSVSIAGVVVCNKTDEPLSAIVVYVSRTVTANSTSQSSSQAGPVGIAPAECKQMGSYDLQDYTAVYFAGESPSGRRWSGTENLCFYRKPNGDVISLGSIESDGRTLCLAIGENANVSSADLIYFRKLNADRRYSEFKVEVTDSDIIQSGVRIQESTNTPPPRPSEQPKSRPPVASSVLPSKSCVVPVTGRQTSLNPPKVYLTVQNNCSVCAKVMLKMLHCADTKYYSGNVASGRTFEGSWDWNPYCGNAVADIHRIDPC